MDSAWQVTACGSRLLPAGQQSAQGRLHRSAQHAQEVQMGTLINIAVTGFVGSEPQVREVGEQRVASFSVAVNRRNRSGEQQTLWVRVNCWNRLADVAAQYVHKGSQVLVTAEWLRPSAWIDQSCEFQRNLRIARDSNVT
jgi:single stranded DNA-binding protein